jgi:hypothetical protein
MKYKTTAKALKEGYYYIVSAGYCELQGLLKYKNPVAYSAGVYGWNFDVYDINGIAIVTGYRSMPSKNTTVNYEAIRAIEKESYNKTADELDALIAKFIDNAKNK